MGEEKFVARNALNNAKYWEDLEERFLDYAGRSFGFAQDRAFATRMPGKNRPASLGMTIMKIRGEGAGGLCGGAGWRRRGGGGACAGRGGGRVRAWGNPRGALLGRARQWKSATGGGLRGDCAEEGGNKRRGL